MNRPRSVLSGATALAATAVLVASTQAPAPAAPFSVAAASVAVDDDSFSPRSVTVTAGQTVTWTNNGDDHTVTADNGSFDSGNLVTGATYRRAFNTVGTYAYHCVYHDGMTGSVTVNRAPVVATVVSFGPTPLRLAGTGRLRAVYRIGQASTLRASVQHLRPLYTVRTFAQRTLQGAGRTSYVWDGKTNRRRDVRPGRYRMNLTVVDRAGSRRVVRTTFRVVR